MKKIFSDLKNFNIRLWISLCALALVPALYQTVKTFFISFSGQAGAFDIIGQMEWFGLINETLQAFLIIPLYSVLNRIFKHRPDSFAAETFKTGTVSFILYTLFSVGVLIYGEHLLTAMNPAEIDLSAAAAYLRLETVAFMAGIVVSFANVVFVVIGKDKNVYIFLVARTLLSLLADFILIPVFGIYGAAISNIISNLLLSVICIVLLYRQKYIKFCPFKKTDFVLFRDWLKTGFFSGLQQFIDNFIYAVMVCKTVNAVSQSGNYWIANNFIWGWLLIPVTALAEVIRSDCKDGYENLHKSNYHFIALLSFALWIITVPLWTPFFRCCQHLENAEEIFFIVIKLVPFYFAYAGCVIIDNIFIGLGKTVCTAVNSLIINLVYYGIFYILYITRAVEFNMNTIILMFGFGMVAHLAISVVEERIVGRKNNKTSQTAAPD